MFTINQGFDLNSPQFNFKRDYFASVADLKAAPETSFPDHFITNVAGVLYQLTKSNSADATTGKWRKVQLGSDVDLSDYATKNNVIVSSTIESDSDSVSIYFKKGDDSQSNYDIPNASHSSAGVITASDKTKLDGIAVDANKYVLPTATTAALGGIKTNYTNNGKNYKVDVDSFGNAYVNVPWTDTKTDISKCITLTNEAQTFDGDKELHLNENNSLGIQVSNNDGTSRFKFTKDGLNINLNSSIGLKLSGTGIAIMTNNSINSGGANRLFATDGSTFDASKLATTAALSSALALYVKSTTLTTKLTKYAKLDGNNTFTGIITAQGFKLPNGNSDNLLAADGSLINLANLVKRSYSATDATAFSIDWIRQFDGYTTNDSFVNNTTGFGLVRELRGGKSEVLIDSTGDINISSGNIKICDKHGINNTNALTFNGNTFSIKSENGTSAQYYAADGSIQTLTAISTEKLNEIFV